MTTIEQRVVLIAVMLVEVIGKDFENGEHLEIIFGVERIRSKLERV